MVMKKKIIAIFTALLLIFPFLQNHQVQAVENVSLFTPYTGTTARPGDTIDYEVTVINSGSAIKNMSFRFDNLPEGWEGEITAGGREIKELSVRGDREETINVEVTVPLDADMADYRFSLVATDGSSNSTLPLLITVTEQGSFETELTTDQANLQGHSDSSFDYSVTLRNRTANTQNYALSTNVGNGWNVVFSVGSDNVTSVSLEPNESTDITVKVTPPENVEAGTYEIPIKAATSSTSAELVLEAVITGTYAVELSTPNGLLSTDIVAGKDRTIDLVVTNTGTATLTNLQITANTPTNWESEFDNSTIDKLEPNESKTIKATITASDDAIAGDYSVSFSVTAAEARDTAQFRVSVETSTLWGIVAILIILGVLGGLYYIFRKYGRR